MLKLRVVHTIRHNSDKFRSILIIFRELLNTNKAHIKVGQDSTVSIATRYGLDGLGIESRWGRDFPHPSRPTLGPTQPPIQWVPGLSRV
jgi:hypothetical protein